MTIQSRRYNGLASLLENAETLAAIRSPHPQVEPRDLSYLESCADCAISDLSILLETFARVVDDCQLKSRNVPVEDVMQALTKLSHLTGGVIPELEDIRASITWAREVKS